MRRIIIICEGQTEQEFCRDVLYPFFLQNEIIIQCPVIKKSRGGIVNWSVLKSEIELHLRYNKTKVWVTTFIDYYGLKEKHGFPDWNSIQKTVVKVADKLTALESSMQESITENIRYRFIPYIQMHEFEGLLFCDAEVFRKNFSPEELTDFSALEKIIATHPNPEDINDGKETAPSKRLIQLIVSYHKTVYGAILAQEIGLEKIRAKCMRFNQWIEKLLTID